jgi:tRNA uridine 5-carbamoylmethylation protein Kti12
MNIYVLSGLPGSGKSTWAKEQSLKNGSLIINRDSLRSMFYGYYKFDKDFEYLIKECALELINKLINFNVKDIVIDECNLTKIARSFWLNDIDFSVSLEERKDIKVILVWFKENKRNVELRTKGDLRGFTSEYWGEVIDNMKKIYENPDISEGFDEIIEVVI